MKIFTLYWPGTCLDVAPGQPSIQILLNQLDVQLADASVGLALFKDEIAVVGQIPQSYRYRLRFVQARTVLYSLDAIGKILNALAAMSSLPAEVKVARDGYRRALPELKDVQDSTHHTEDPTRALHREATELPPELINSGMISAPNGGVLGLSNLNGNKVGYTASDGHHCEVEISDASVAAAQTAIQQVLNALAWTGPPHKAPSDA